MAMADEDLNNVIASLIDDFDEDESQDIEPKKEQVSDPVVLTSRAVKQINKIRKDENLDEHLFLRVAVEGGGCSGLSYKLGFDIRTDEDQLFHSGGLDIIIDPNHLIYLGGIEIDYPDGLDARGFTFDNPNASESCGCGSSFAV
jgi:iron-sulfur cluster assembly accessory protein